MKISKKLIVLILAFIFLILTVISIQTTYARFVTALTARSYVEIGSWLLRVNDQNIIEETDFSSTLTPVFEVRGDLISSDIIAPTSIGYIDININYSDVTVPFKYNLSYEQDATLKIEDFNLVRYEIDGVSYDCEDYATLEHSVIPDGVKKTQLLRLYFEWQDKEDEELNDIADTNKSHLQETIKYNLKLNFTQIIIVN